MPKKYWPCLKKVLDRDWAPKDTCENFGPGFGTRQPDLLRLLRVNHEKFVFLG